MNIKKKCLSKIISEKRPSQAENRCSFCDKTYYDKSTLNRHFSICKKKKENDKNMKIIIKRLEKENHEMRMKFLGFENEEEQKTSIINNNINNINSGNVTNITNNIQINNYHEEYVDYVTPAFIRKIKYMTPLNALLCLTNHIYCNPRRNDNWNIMVINQSHDRCKIKSEKYWETKSINKIVENNLIRTSCRINDIIDNAAVSEGRERDEKGFPILDEFEKRLIECYNHLNDEKYAKEIKDINRKHKDCLIDHCERNKIFLNDQMNPQNFLKKN